MRGGRRFALRNSGVVLFAIFYSLLNSAHAESYRILEARLLDRERGFYDYHYNVDTSNECTLKEHAGLLAPPGSREERAAFTNLLQAYGVKDDPAARRGVRLYITDLVCGLNAEAGQYSAPLMLYQSEGRESHVMGRALVEIINRQTGVIEKHFEIVAKQKGTHSAYSIFAFRGSDHIATASYDQVVRELLERAAAILQEKDGSL